MSSKLLTGPSQGFRNEAYVGSLLHHRDVGGGVRLIGVYSTEAHPFGLVYEYMDGLDLRQHLGNMPNVEGLKLVLISTYPLPLLSVNPLMFLGNSWRK